MRAEDLEKELVALEAMSGTDLRSLWVRLLGEPVPQVKRRLLRMALAWELQARVHGGLPRRVSQRLDQLAAAKTRTLALRPGMQLVREWNGMLHQVMVEEEGRLLWKGERWTSLSEIARAITGTRWSGPAFFGLKTAVKEKGSARPAGNGEGRRRVERSTLDRSAA